MYNVAEFAPARPVDQLRSRAATVSSTPQGCRVESRRTLNLATGAEVEHVTLSHPGALADVAWSRDGDRDFCRLFESFRT